MQQVLSLEVAPARARVYEEGWQSWSPSRSYPLSEQPLRAASPINHRGGYGGTRPMPEPGTFCGEGLLAVDPGTGGPVVVVGADSAAESVPRITARLSGNRLEVAADGPVLVSEHPADADLPGALGAFADGFAARAGTSALRPAPTLWCSWYHYFTEVTQADMAENIAAVDSHDLPVRVIQLDDGYQSEIGDWLELSDRFDSLGDMVSRIADTGRQAGIWIAPFLAGARSRVAAEHPDWLITDADGPVLAHHNWNQDVFALDPTHPGVESYLAEVFGRFVELGFDFIKADFLYAGALDGRRHADLSPVAGYRHGLDGIRRAVGEAYLLGCGAPILPSVGKVDAMRISPDTAPHFEPIDGDLSKPGGRAAIVTGAARAWQHGRFWVNDPDCLLVRPAVERREELAAHVAEFGGLRGSSDRIADLDGWGLEQTRTLLGSVPPVTPMVATAGSAGPA